MLPVDCLRRTSSFHNPLKPLIIMQEQLLQSYQSIKDVFLVFTNLKIIIAQISSHCFYLN
jgi:hypothetical protein